MDKIGKLIVFFLVLWLPSYALAQTTRQDSRVDSLRMKDQYGTVIEHITDSTLTYITKDSAKLIIPLPANSTIHYVGGIESLKRNICLNVPEINSENHIQGLFYILFNSCLQIKEIRVINIAPIVPFWEKMTESYISYLYKTQGKWVKDIDGLPWYLYTFAMTLH